VRTGGGVMTTKQEIENKIGEIQELGREEIIHLARKVLDKYKKPQVFTMAMGVYVFEDDKGENMYQKYCTKELDAFLCDLDHRFGFTGQPLRITKDLQIDPDY
jgi:hypothetical protein